MVFMWHRFDGPPLIDVNGPEVKYPVFSGIIIGLTPILAGLGISLLIFLLA